MAFTIKAVASEGAWTPLTFGRSDSETNVFSLIVGRNATGKSRLLRKIVSHYIFDHDSKSILDPQVAHDITAASNVGEMLLSPNSNLTPSRVIAVSTGRHDRFPRPREPSYTFSKYHYIAPSEHGGPTSLTRSLTSIIGGLEGTDSKHSDLLDILKYLDFAPHLEFKILVSPRYRSFIKSENDPQSSIHWMLLEEGHSNRRSKEHWSLDRLHHTLSYIGSRNGINCEIDLISGIRTHAAISSPEIMEGLNSGALKIADLTLYTRSTKRKVKLSQASSGQQCMLTMILGIAGSIQDNSLICIDEPEISLHPEWQTDVIGKLQRAFSGYTGCHFIIATHSPQIVAGLTTKNGFVLDLEEQQLHQSKDYANRSADFQLAQIFNAPGLNNEYLIRVSLSILSKLSKRQDLSPDDAEKISMLADIRESLSEVDPVRHLVDQVLALR
ncbi:AAA family ATPase [uncultured Stenotrophomonas sp.]|uniref:AAA family ATPase n=1 Tax=uncultured Stenotrophomonas sp. TaxID=165438 RepID=UPI0028E1E998|nr:AAA family ATPase [uncultured Stenotrophomonas sp.]